MKVSKKLELMLMRYEGKCLKENIYTLQVTDKVIDFFQDHVHCVFLWMGVVGVGGCLDPSPAPAPHLYITSH